MLISYLSLLYRFYNDFNELYYNTYYNWFLRDNMTTYSNQIFEESNDSFCQNEFYES